MSQFLVRPEDLDRENLTATVHGEEAHHLARVARVRTGETVSLFDGAGGRWRGRVESHAKDSTLVSGLAPLPSNEPEHPVILAAGLIKADRWEWLIEKAVELGATEIAPLDCERSQTGVGDAAKKASRWEKIILAAAKQCERGAIPRLRNPSAIAEFLSSLGSPVQGEARWAFLERTGGVRPGQAGGPTVAAIGPEGGFTESEAAQLLDAGFAPATLGGRILRAETAAAAALALVVPGQKNG